MATTLSDKYKLQWLSIFQKPKSRELSDQNRRGFWILRKSFSTIISILFKNNIVDIPVCNNHQDVADKW